MLKFFRFLLLGLIRRFYRVRIQGQENLPSEEQGGALLVANHITWIDAFLLSLLSERQIRFVIDDEFLKFKAIAWFIRMVDAVPISRTRGRDAIKVTANAVADGHIVCLFPEGQLSRSGLMTELQRGIELIVRQSKSPVIPVYLDGLWGSIFSYERGRYFTKWPYRVPFAATAIIGEPLTAADATTANIRRSLQKLSVQALSGRPELHRPLGTAALDALKRRPARPLFLEYSKPGDSGAKGVRKVSRATAIAAAIALSSRWKVSLPKSEKRVGILLPGGAASGFMNLGLVLAGRVPVNLPFGGDPVQLAKMIDQLGIRTVLTSRAFTPVLEKFPWQSTPGKFVDLRSEIDAAGSVRMLLERAKACFEPKSMARKRLELDELADDPDAEAFAYVWHDGDRDELRSTFLSHFDVQTHVTRMTSGSMLTRREERIFCEQPINSAVGSLFSLWIPVLGEMQAVARSAGARSDADLIESVVSQSKTSVLISSTELREQIADVEEWHPSIGEHLRRIFNFELDQVNLSSIKNIDAIPLFHGWALDEQGAVLSMSLPDSLKSRPNQMDQPGHRAGSVGRLLPAIAPSETVTGELLLHLPSPDGGRDFASGVAGKIDNLDFVFLGNDADSGD